MSQRAPHAHPLGDSAVTVRFGGERSTELLLRVRAAALAVKRAQLPGVEDVVPAYLSLSVFYDPLRTSYSDIAAQIIEATESITAPEEVARPRQHIIPVKYDGIDLEAVAVATGLDVEQVIARHSARAYTVDLLGFVPGFGYLSELDTSLRLPRRADPRQRVAAGSVAIAGAQTAVYPLNTPGGWHLIGRTTTVMFDPARDPPALLAAGDHVRFERET